MKISLLDLKPQHDPIHKEIMPALERIVRSNVFILGQEVTTLEERIAAYSGARFGIGVSSGTDALLVSLMALEIGPGDEVITSPYSFFATAGAVARVGAKPVFVDIDPATFNIDPAGIEKAITSKTKAIIPVHLYGQCAEMAPILETARRYGLKVIEDAAQAIGTDYRDGGRAGSLGALGCLSFFPTKNLGGMGDGGMVLVNDEYLAERVRILRVHGSHPKYYHRWIGGNFRLDAMQAVVLNVKLSHLDEWTRQRRENARRYDELFPKGGLVSSIPSPRLRGEGQGEGEGKEVVLPAQVHPNLGLKFPHTYNQYVIRVPDRDRLREDLKQNGIDTEIYYPVPLHLQECFRYLGHKEGDFPESERAARETLALPIYPGLTAEEQGYIVNQIRIFFE